MLQLPIDGAVLAYRTAGDGPPLVFVHGSASDHRTWEHQVDALADRFRTVAFSRRFHWPNAPIPDGTDYAMGQHVDDLGAVLRTLGAAPAHLVGHSYGALLALLLAMRQPALVRTLVLAEPPALTLFVSDPPRPLELLRLLATRPRTALGLIRLGATGIEPATRAFRRGEDEAGARIFGQALFGRAGYAALPEARRQQVRDNLTNVRAEFLGAGFLPLEAERIRQVQTPTLLVVGGASRPVFRRLADRLEELLPHAERVTIPAGSHVMHEDAPAAFNEALRAFLARHDPSEPSALAAR